MSEWRDEARSPPTDLPTGTVTFLFTDIEGSTNLVQELGEDYGPVQDDHHRILREAIAEGGGNEVRTEGDSFFATFTTPAGALRTAVRAQRELAAHPWTHGRPLRVRMGLHTGEGQLRGGEYVGIDVNRAARIAAAGHGGQVLLSEAAKSLVERELPQGVTLRDLGSHRLKDLASPERIYQLVIDDLPADFPELKSLDARPHNLPAEVTSFVGRTREKQEIFELLGSSRLVTLTGPGGTGKTRLALEVAGESLDTFEDGVFFIPLAAITEGDLVIPTVATTLGVRETPARPIRDALIEYLREQTMLILLDNFEHLVAMAPEVGELLAAAPRLKAIVTSREPLRIAGEQEFAVPPLALPDGGARGRLDELQAVDSVALFLQRARSVRPGFALTPDNAEVVAEICARLDGLPLALELAAARVRLFGPEELLARLSRRLSFLRGGRDLTERQRTLRGAIDWSHELLPEPEQVVFRRLSVFAGGCSLRAVEAVCGSDRDELDVVEVISSLHDKSLVGRDDTSAGGLRVRMLETIREYARERLETSGEGPEIDRRHAEFFRQLAERAAPNLRGPKQQRWLDELERELDNFRAAIGWAVEARESEVGLRLASALNVFWIFRNHLKEGRRHLEELLALRAPGESLAARAAAVGVAADIAGWQGDYDSSRPLAEESLAMYRELGDVAGTAAQLIIMGYASVISDPVAAVGLFEQSIDALREGSEPLLIGQALIGLSLPEMQLRNLEEATSHLKEATAMFRRAGDESLTLIAEGLQGVCARLKGDLIDARRRYVDVLVRGERAGADMALTLPLAALADLALLEGDPERATVLEAAHAKVAERLGGTPSFRLLGIPDVLERARAELDADRYEAAVARGRSAPLDEIVRLALSDPGETTFQGPTTTRS
jgi:predicted ATPase/class 3 adenylate cyclase